MNITVKQTFRLLKENKLLSTISILGTALAICLIMVIVILYVANTAGFPPEVNRDRTYYVSSVLSSTKEDNRRMSYSSCGLPFLKETLYPLQKSAEAVTVICRDPNGLPLATTMDGLHSYSSHVIYTDPGFWKVFGFDFIEGEPFSQATFDSSIRDVVISEPVARELFGSEKAVGKEIKLDFITYRVCGVVKQVSRFASKSWADVWTAYTTKESVVSNSWTSGINGLFYACILLKQESSREALEAEIGSLLKNYNTMSSTYKAELPGQPKSQVEEWFYQTKYSEDVKGLYIRYGIILLVLLLVPALNLSGITLTLVRKRLAELGVRRSFGATQGVIIRQVLMENLATTLFGGFLGLLFSYVSLWFLKDWLLMTRGGEAGLSTGMFNGYVFCAAFAFCLVMNLLSAGIPAWRVSRHSIVNSLNA